MPPRSEPRRTLSGLACVLVIVGAVPKAATAATITIGALAPIADQGPLDLNPLADILDFNVVDPVTGYNVKGQVNLTGGGAFAAIGGAPLLVLNLTDFSAGRPPGALGGALTISIDHPFVLAGPINAYDYIAPIAARVGPSPALGAGSDSLVSYQGFVNGIGIGTPFANQPSPAYPALLPGIPFQAPYLARIDSFCGGDGVPAVPGNPPPPPAAPPATLPCLAGGPNWLLREELSFSLGAVGDNFVLLGSAEAGISGTVPEPSTILLVGLGVCGAVCNRRRGHRIGPSESRKPSVRQGLNQHLGRV